MKNKSKISTRRKSLSVKSVKGRMRARAQFLIRQKELEKLGKK